MASKRPNRFRETEKKFKLYKGKNKKRRITDFSSVLDLREYKGSRAVLVDETGKNIATSSCDVKKQGEGPKIWRISEVEGLYVITDALDKEAQAFWAGKAVSQFSKCEHTNLTNLYGKQPDHWKQAVTEKKLSRDSGFYKLRWSSLGYHFDWTNRLYYKNELSDFPNELAKLASKLARKVGYDVKAEAAIVNYFPYDGMMGGHVDDAELTLSYPIVSISIGCTAIFLIGGKTREVAPLALYVRSGDVIIMGGQSRVCYHGVPRIIEGTAGDLVKSIQETAKDDDTKLLASFLSRSRININIRQVIDERDNFESISKPAYTERSEEKKADSDTHQSK